MRADIGGAEMQVARPPGRSARAQLPGHEVSAGRPRADAVAQLGEALRLKPDDAEAHSNLGIAFQLQGRTADAVRELRDAARLKPDDDRVHFNLGNVMQASQTDGRGGS